MKIHVQGAPPVSDGAHGAGARALITTMALAALCGAGACSDTVEVPDAQTPATIEVLAGSGQTGRVAQIAYQSLSVTVQDAHRQPLAGATVHFTSDKNGSFGATDIVSDAEGTATALFTYGNTSGDYKVIATIDGVADTASFVLHADPDPPHAIQALAGDAQTSPSGTSLTNPLSIELMDEFGNPIAGSTVTWTVTNGGTLSSPTSVTDENGRATVQLTLGPTPGTEVVTAHVENVEDVKFVEIAN